MPGHSRHPSTPAFAGRLAPGRPGSGRSARLRDAVRVRCAEVRRPMDDADTPPFRGRLLHYVRHVVGAPA